MNAEQAKQISSIEDYKRITGAKRFKRTKDEMARGLSVEQALQERIQQAQGIPQVANQDAVVKKIRETDDASCSTGV